MSVVDTVLHKIFGTPHERKVKQLRPVIAKIHAARQAMEALDDAALAAKSAEFREKLKNGASLEDIKVEAFAVCQEACDRRLGIFNIFKPEFEFDFSRLGPELQAAADAAKAELAAGKNEWEVYLPAALYAKVRELYPESVKPFRMMPFDVQMIGGLVLHEGAIAEMATGEGKTLAAALPVYLNGLGGHGVHVVTVNDYLAGRDAKQMGLVYQFLGLTVGLIVNGLNPEQRRKSYNSDVTYGTNNEFGFDYLRDNMAVEPDQLVQRELNFCIVDEVDSILIDEARTPLIISGPAEDATDKYAKANEIAQKLVKNKDFSVDEKDKNIQLTEKGVNHVESLMQITNLYGEHADWVHFLDQALRAWHLYERDVDYIVRDGEIIIVDENTGRLMEGRRYSNGMHAGHHYLPELLPHVQEALRHDRYCRNGSYGIHQNLQHEHLGDSHQQALHPQRHARHGVQVRGRQVESHRGRNQGPPRKGPAPAGGYRFHRKVRTPPRPPGKRRNPPRGAERQEP